MVIQSYRPEYDLTVIGHKPEDWKVSVIGNIGEVFTGGTPNTKEKRFWNGKIPWVASGNIHQGFIHEPTKYISDDGLHHSNCSILPLDTVLIALNGQGKTRGMVGLLKIKATCNQSIAGVVVNKDNIDPNFLYYQLQKRYQEIRNLSGEGRNGLNLTLIRSLPVVIPTIPEQQKIAKILSDTDSLIESLDKLITKKKRIKQGLIQTLLTRGIGHTKFKKTEIGEIPEEWYLKRVGDLFSLEYGTGLPNSKRIGKKYRVFGSNGVIGFSDDFLIEGPGIVVGRKGSIGKVTWSDSNFWPIDTTYYVKLKSNLDLRWLFYKLTDLELERLNTATGVPGLNRDSIYNLLIGGRTWCSRSTPKNLGSLKAYGKSLEIKCLGLPSTELINYFLTILKMMISPRGDFIRL